jgi:3-oxoacyl-[acyl-carrier protein] reductase
VPGMILVTGASGGMGAPLCVRLARAGNRLVLAARDRAKLEALAAELPSSAPVHVLPVDMSSEPSVAAFGANLAALDLVLDGAVIMPPQPDPSTDPLPGNDTWRGLFNDSFIGPLSVLKIAIAAMKPDPASGRRAKVVIVSGITSVQALGNYATSNVLRTAWLAEAKTLAFALGERGIHVNTVSFGGTLTSHFNGLIAGRAAKNGISFEAQVAKEVENPLRKYGTPDEAALAIETLLSGFSDHITGINLLHDGGFTRAY